MCKWMALGFAVLLSGCAVNQASFSLRDRELFVSPNRHHFIQLDSTLYYFEYKVDDGLNHWVPPRKEVPPLFDLVRDEYYSSVPQTDDTADRQTIVKRRVPGEGFCPGQIHLRLLPEACR